jgi:O-antigen/teichoic acid export membrane protein
MEALGVFSVAVSIAESLWIICRSIATIQLSRIINEPDPKQQRSITKHLSVVSAGATAIGVLVLMLIPQEVYMLIFGAEFGSIPEIVMWFSPAILFLAFYTIFNHYFSGKDMNWINIKASLFGNLILVIVSYVMIENYGLNGAALAYGFAFLGMSAYLIWAFYRVEKVEDQTNSIVSDHE